MKLRILGPIELFSGHGPVYLARRQQRLILGILAVEAGRVVSSDRMIELIWAVRPPRQARAVVQTRVSELRAILSGEPDGFAEIVTSGNGYTLTIEPQLVDLHEFRHLVGRAQEVGSDEQARELLRRGLALWRGPTLGGWLPAVSHAALCGSIEALRLTAAEQLFEVEIRLGNDLAVVDELSELAVANPTRERLALLAMTALHRTGRAAAALQVFDHCRRWLADELGLDPGDELQQVYLSILRGPAPKAEPAEPSAAASEGPADAAPQLLPIDIPDFTGRRAELAQLSEVLGGSDRVVRLAVVSGPAGVGKTALSVHVAHQLQDRFPHGRLYVDLHGADRPGALAPADVLARFLRALGVDSSLPDSLDERAELYRGLLAGREILVALDNARDAEQVRPLIPGSPSCAVLVTSRTRLAAALGGTPIDLDVLDGSQAIDLMARITGEPRVRTEPHAAASLVSLCGGLPLGIRIAAARLVAKPHWTVGKLVDRLSNERRRLDQFSYGDLDVRASIALSYTGMSTEAQLLLCLLGDLDLPEVNVWSAAALLDLHSVEAEEVLEQLYDAQLINAAGRDAAGYSRYRMHDLVRLFAKERAGTDGDPSMEAARARLFGAWLYLVETAYGKVYGAGSENVASPLPRHVVEEKLANTLIADPLAWFDAERQTIIAIIYQAVRQRQSPASWGLACASFSLFEMRRYFDDCPDVLDAAFTLAIATDDRVGCAAVLIRQATLSSNRNDDEQSIDQLRRAVALFEATGNRHGHALASLQLATMYRRTGRYELAKGLFPQAVASLRDSCDKGAEALALRNIAQAHLDTDELATADTLLEQALGLARTGRSRRREAQVLFFQGMLRIKQHRSLDAERLFVEVLSLTRTLGDRPGEIQAQRGLALCNEQNGEVRRAEATLLAALQLARQPAPTLLEKLVRDDLARLAKSDQR